MTLLLHMMAGLSGCDALLRGDGAIRDPHQNLCGSYLIQIAVHVKGDRLYPILCFENSAYELPLQSKMCLQLCCQFIYGTNHLFLPFFLLPWDLEGHHAQFCFHKNVKVAIWFICILRQFLLRSIFVSRLVKI